MPTKCFIDNGRWAGVPFFLRLGMHLDKLSLQFALGDTGLMGEVLEV